MALTLASNAITFTDNTSLSSGVITAAQLSAGAIQESFGNTSGAFNFRNKIINGNFDIWQRGTSHSTSKFGSVDRWGLGLNGSGCTISRQAFSLGQTEVPNEPVYFIQANVSSVVGSTNYVVLEQTIEDVRTLAGKTATLSFYAKADSSKPIAVEFLQSFGTGGSPSTGITNIGTQKFNLTNSWQKITTTVTIPSISGKTLGTNNDNFLSVLFWFDSGGFYNSRNQNLGQQSGTFDIAQVQLEEGSVATPFEQRPIGLELALCQRYYYRISATGLSFPFGTAQWYSSTSAGAYIPFKTEMRVAPTALERSGTASDYGLYSSVGSDLTCTSVPIYAAVLTTKHSAAVNFTVGSGGTAGNMTQPFARNGNAYLGWSAEL
jgi:hypothetical protein